MSKDKTTVKTHYEKKRELAKNKEYIKVNDVQKDWAKSDYLVDMLSKE